MTLAQTAALSMLSLFVGMLVLSEVGRRVGLRKFARDPEGFAKGIGAAEAAVFGLLGLLIAFTFSSAAARFEARRHLITDEANAIGTAYLRVDLLPVDAQPTMRTLFRRYAEVRATTYLDAEERAAAEARLAEGVALQGRIWKTAIAALQRPGVPTQSSMLLLPALNEMIDITTTRVMATRNHPPMIVFLLLGGLSLVGALLVGYGTAADAERNWFHTVIFAAILSLVVYVILDLEFPRLGLIRVDSADQILVELRESMS